MKVLIVENLEADLVRSRVPLGRFFEESQFEVFYACPSRENSRFFNIPMDRDRFKFSSLLRASIALRRIERSANIDAVISFRLVPNFLNLVRSFFSDKKRVIVVTGLGIAFVDHVSKRFIWKKFVIKLFYKVASKRLILVAQNPDDLNELDVNGHVILGSGVKRSNHVAKDFSLPKKLLFVGRLLKSKGILQAYQIFLQLSRRDFNVTLTIVGDIDLYNADSIDSETLDMIRSTPNVEYLGYLTDLESVYIESHILLFPSLYREGVPRVIIESLKFGLTIITYNMPGCKETVQNNGLLVDPKDAMINVAVDYIGDLDFQQLESNSKASWKLFDNLFSDEVIYPEYLKLLKK